MVRPSTRLSLVNVYCECLWLEALEACSLSLSQYGEVDCWPMECPPVACAAPVLAAGDCCPRCQDDPCSLDSGPDNRTAVGLELELEPRQPCSLAGQLYESGTAWTNKCAACNCKVSRTPPAPRQYRPYPINGES